MKNFSNSISLKNFVLCLIALGLILSGGCSRRKSISQNLSLSDTLSVLAISPAYALVGQSGVEVSISGTAFQAGLSIYIGDTLCSNIRFISANQAYCIVPVSAQATTVDVAVTNPDGQNAKLSLGFRYTSPTDGGGGGGNGGGTTPLQITSITPDHGPATGNTPVQIIGTNFPQTTNLIVTFGADFCRSVQVISAQEIRCATPPGTGGPVNVTVATASGGNSDVADQKYSYSPVIGDYNPKQGPDTGNTQIVIVGSGFADGATVKVGGKSCPVLTVQNNRIACTVPAASAGSAAVVVTNPDGLADQYATQYLYTATTPPPPPPPTAPKPPTFTAITPNAGPLAGGIQVKITGANFAPGVRVTLAGNNCGISSSTTDTILCTIPAGTGCAQLVIRNPDNNIATVDNAFTYQPPPTVVLLLNGQNTDLLLGVQDPMTISWDSKYASYCEVTTQNGTSDVWRGTSHPGVGIPGNSFLSEREVRYWLSCTGPGGVAKTNHLVRRYIYEVGGPKVGAHLLRNSADMQACVQSMRRSCGSSNAKYVTWGTANAAQYPNPGTGGPVPYMNEVNNCRCFDPRPLVYWTINSLPK